MSVKIRQNVINNAKKRQPTINQVNGTFYNVGNEEKRGDCGCFPVEIENKDGNIIVDINYGTVYDSEDEADKVFSGVDVDGKHIDMFELRTVKQLYPNIEVYNIIVKVAKEQGLY